MRNQIMKVTNKAQLLAAFTCTLDFPGTSEITLVRKDGSKTHYVLKPYIESYSSAWGSDKGIRAAKRKIRRMPAETFK